MKRIVVFIFLGFSLLLSAQPKETYCFVERDSSLWLDVYRPTQPRADKACVVSVFGGGFISGRRDGRLQTTIAKLLTERGFTVVCIDYRLGLRDTARMATYHGISGMQDMFQYCIDIAVEDCSAAVGWLCDHADTLGIDSSHIVLTGSSAGAIAVLQLDWCRANGLPQTSVLPAGWKPAAVVPYSGGLMCRKKELRYAVPPAPTFFLHGEKDKIVSYKKLVPLFSRNLYGSDRLAKVMKQGGYPYWIARFPCIGHEVASWLPGSVDLFCAFVNQALAGRVTTLDATMTDSKLLPTRVTDMSLKDLYSSTAGQP